jgi:hypothetical protein
MKKLLIGLLVVLCCHSVSYAANQFDFLLSQVRTSAQGALIGGKVYFYAPGTTTPKTIYLDRLQVTLAANPYTLDANATAQLYGYGTYRIVVKDASGTTRFDRDNIVMAGDDSTINGVDATSGPQTFFLPASGNTIICKTDATANKVTINVSVGGQTQLWDPLSIQGECIRLGLVGTTWYRE